MKIKCLKYDKALPNVIQYRYDYSSQYHTIVHQPKRIKTAPTVSFPQELATSYSKLLPITIGKKKDLQEMCRNNFK
jgi:hypothetical protein